MAASLRRAGQVSPERHRLLVAVSGGADSTALLLALCALRSRGPLPADLVACYVDHGLREAAEVAAERESVQELCDRLSIPLVVKTVDVAGAREAMRLSWESAARRCRYAALREAAVGAGASAVLTGHTADDQVETVLLRLLRGTGPRGLRGMAPSSRPWGAHGPALVRPLLSLHRADTEAYCRASGVAWVEDSSNRSPRFLRNRVRHELLPVLQALRPAAPHALLRLTEQAAALDHWLSALVEEQLARLWVRDGDEYRLLRPETALHPYLAEVVVAAALARLYEGPGAPSARHVQAVARVWSAGRGNAELPSGWRVRGSAAGVTFTTHAHRRSSGPELDLTGAD